MIKILKKKLGERQDDACYVVDGEKFYSRLFAMQKAQSLCTTPDPHEVWGKVKFQFPIIAKGDEPESNIQDLSMERANHIRQKNKHVRIWASGGADSTNTILNFKKAGIRPDELATYVQWPGEVEAAQNIEVDFSYRPFLKKLSKDWKDVNARFFHVLPDHYHWYSINELEHWIGYTMLHPPAFNSQIVYECFPDLVEEAQIKPPVDIYSGPDFFLGKDANGWFYRFLDHNFNFSFNSPYQIYFIGDSSDTKLFLKMCYLAKKHIISKNGEDCLGQWFIKSTHIPEFQYQEWPQHYDFIQANHGGNNHRGILNWGSKGSVRFLNMITSEMGQKTLMSILHRYKEINDTNPHWFNNGNIIYDWVGMFTPKVYFEKS